MTAKEMLLETEYRAMNISERYSSSKSFKERYNELKEEIIFNKFFYHVSPDEQLVLQHKGLFVSNRIHGLYTYNFATRNSETEAVWKLKPRRPLDIFNLFNPNDIRELESSIKREGISHDEIIRAGNFIFSENDNWNNKKYTYTAQDIIDLLDAFKNGANVRHHNIFNILSAVIYLTGSDGWSEDSIVTKDPLTVSKTYFSKGSIFVFDAKECLEIVEQLDPGLLNDPELKIKAMEAGKYPAKQMRSSK